MNTSALEKTLQQTLDGEITFPQVVGACIEQGLESYHVDLVRSEYRYYHPSGESFQTKVDYPHNNPQKEFSAEKVIAAIRASQAGQIKYKQFIDQILAAGCVYYITYITGKKVVYFGRNGEAHTEHFPQVK